MTHRIHHLLVIAGARDVGPLLHRLRADLAITAMVSAARLRKVRHPDECVRVVAVATSAGTKEWVALAEAVHGVHRVDGVAAFGEFDQDKAVAIAGALGLPFHGREVIEAVSDKVVMRRRLHAADVDDTPFAGVETARDIDAFVREHGLPVIVKPRRGTGSRGVAKISAPADLEPALAWARPARENLIVEAVLDGAEISVESFSEDGQHLVLGVTEKLIEAAHFVEIGHVVRAATAADTAIAEYIPRVLTALGIAYGPAHTELIVTPRGLRVVETHTRAGGDQIPQLLADATGIDLVEAAARQALGERVLPDLAKRLRTQDGEQRAGAIRYLEPTCSGVLVSLENSALAAATPYVTECKSLKNAGDALAAPMRDSHDRIAYCKAVAPDGVRALRAAEEAIGKLAVTVRP